VLGSIQVVQVDEELEAFRRLGAERHGFLAHVSLLVAASGDRKSRSQARAMAGSWFWLDSSRTHYRA
jgi:hypothetical protein